MMRWPRPPAARKFRVRLVVRRAEGLQQPCAAAAEHAASAEAEAPPTRVAAELRWKGPKASPLSSLRRTAVRRNRTREAEAEAAAVVACATAADDAAAAAGAGDAAGVVVAAWEEEFESTVTLAAASHREHAAFQPWELAFSVFTVSIFFFFLLVVDRLCSSHEFRDKTIIIIYVDFFGIIVFFSFCLFLVSLSQNRFAC